MSIRAVIPTIGEAPQLPELIHQLLHEGATHVWLVVNRQDARDKVHETKNWVKRECGLATNVVCLHHTDSIYQSWNIGVERARERGADLVAVLNDDVELQPGALQLVTEAFVLDPTVDIVGFDYGVDTRLRVRVGPLLYVSGSYRNGGIGGFAFVVRTKPFRYVGVDEQFEWWYGDDDLFLEMERQGSRLAIRVGAGVAHASETTARNHTWTFEARARDAVRFQAKWEAP